MQIMAGSGRILFLARKKVMTAERRYRGGCIRNYIGNCTSSAFQGRRITSSIALSPKGQLVQVAPQAACEFARRPPFPCFETKPGSNVSGISIFQVDQLDEFQLQIDTFPRLRRNRVSILDLTAGLSKRSKSNSRESNRKFGRRCIIEGKRSRFIRSATLHPRLCFYSRSVRFYAAIRDNGVAMDTPTFGAQIPPNVPRAVT